MEWKITANLGSFILLKPGRSTNKTLRAHHLLKLNSTKKITEQHPLIKVCTPDLPAGIKTI